MFLVECSDLNDSLVKICKEMINKILKKTEDFVYQETATKLHTEIRNMSNHFNVKADNSADLVASELYLEQSKNTNRGQLVNQYFDLVDWLMMLHQQPDIEISDDYIKNITLAYQATNRIQSNIETQEANLKLQREEIEKRLMIETKQFQEELNEVKSKVDKFKDNHVKKKEEEYNKEIDKINKTLANLTTTMAHINKQEKDLDANLSEWP